MSAPVSTTQTSTTAAPQVLRLSDHDDDDNAVKQDSSSSGNRDRKDDKTNNAVSVPWDIPSPPTFQDPHEYRAHLKGRLALAFRIFAKYGYDEGVAGHITVKDPVDPTCFWVNPFGVSWARLQASDLILVNSQGTVVAGGPVRRLNTGAFMIHHAVHTARPEATCVAHSHTIYGRAFSALGRKLDIITQDSCVFYNHQSVQSDFTGSALELGPGQAVADALGPENKLVILQNHGLLTVGRTVESAVFWFMSAEKCCQSQLAADAAARGRDQETIKVRHEDAKRAFETVGTEDMGWFSAMPTFDDMARVA
ncbi:hypothetical protein LTS17_008605 [Exophiala oligosperma]